VSEWLPSTDDAVSPWYPWQDAETWKRAQELRSPAALPQPLTADDLREALGRTVIIETPQGDLVCAPGQTYLVGPPNREWVEVTDVTLTEEQFWQVVHAVYGPDEVARLRQDVDAILRWEGEGGPCLD
jgi:hypothetical protein